MRTLAAIFLLGLAFSAHAQSSSPAASKEKIAVFAGGCFWCMQPPFDRAKGVTKTVVGYTGGSAQDATYPKVSAHKTQHREAIEVTYDPAQVSYEQLLDVFWRNINPTQGNGQFADIGLSYQAAIYYGDESEKKLAEASKEKLGKSGKFDKPIVTEILAKQSFYPAEEYHQKYYQKNPSEYKAYHIGSGREGFIERIWGKSEGK